MNSPLSEREHRISDDLPDTPSREMINPLGNRHSSSPFGSPSRPTRSTLMFNTDADESISQREALEAQAAPPSPTIVQGLPPLHGDRSQHSLFFRDETSSVDSDTPIALSGPKITEKPKRASLSRAKKAQATYLTSESGANSPNQSWIGAFAALDPALAGMDVAPVPEPAAAPSPASSAPAPALVSAPSNAFVSANTTSAPASPVPAPVPHPAVPESEQAEISDDASDIAEESEEVAEGVGYGLAVYKERHGRL